MGFAYSYVYNYTDHLGNIRLSYAQDPENPNVLKIIEESHYYPFGLKHANYNSDQLAFKEKDPGPGIMLAAAALDPVPEFVYNYKYNGKEFQDEMSLNWYDYGARNYDPAIGRWMNMDPLAEKMRRHSPYNYAFNNPLRFVDPDGMKPVDWYLNLFTGVITWKDGQGSRFGYQNLGHSWSATDVNGNRFLMDGETKQISYKGIVLADFNKKSSGKPDGFAIADGGNNSDPSSLRNGGRNVQWLDFKGLIGLIDLLLGREPGKLGKVNPKGKGTNGGGPTMDNKVGDAMDAVSAGTGAAKEVDEATKNTNDKEKESDSSKPTEFVQVNYDEKTGNSTWIRKDIYDKQ